MNTHAVMDHKAAFGRLDEGLRLALEQAEGDPAMLAWLIGATLAPLVALALSARFGVVAVSAYLLSGVICTLLALRINRRIEQQGS